MTEQPQQPDADSLASTDAQANDAGSNGTYPDAAVGIAEITGAQAVDVDDRATLEAPADIADAAAEEPAEQAAESAQDDAPPDDSTAFLAELARAMQATAGNERKRIDEDIERRRAAHLEGIRGRRESETAAMRGLAAEDEKAIDEWAQGEHQRINAERGQRAAALQKDLEASLAEHAAKIDNEIEGVEAAIAGYRTEVDTFFRALEAETDPVEIAHNAARRPVFPDLDAVSAAKSGTPPQAEAAQVSIGVMDPEAAADPATAWARWNEAPRPPEVMGSPEEPEISPNAVEAPRSLLLSTPADRPYAHLSREPTEDH